MTEAIELIDSKPGSGNVSIRIGDVTIHDAKIVQQSGRGARLAMPDLIELDEDLHKAVSDTIVAAWEARQKIG